MADRFSTRVGFDAAAAADFTALGRYLWDPISEAMVALVGPRPGERILDACCGTGASARPAARLVGPDGVVDAVDVSGSMAGELRRLAAGLPQLAVHQADVTEWPADGYDVVQCSLGIFFFPDITAGTEYLIARARPGGRVALTLWRAGAVEPAGRYLGRAVAAATGEEAPGERPRYLFDEINKPDAYAAWLAERGLSDVEVTVREARLSMTPEIAWLVILGSGYRAKLTELAPETVEEVRERYLKALAADGVTELDVTTLIGFGRREW